VLSLTKVHHKSAQVELQKWASVRPCFLDLKETYRLYGMSASELVTAEGVRSQDSTANTMGPSEYMRFVQEVGRRACYVIHHVFNPLFLELHGGGGQISGFDCEHHGPV